MVVLCKSLGKLGLRIFHTMSLIYLNLISSLSHPKLTILRTNNHVHPAQSAKRRSILDDILICRQQNLELAHPDFLHESTTLGRVAFVRDHLDARSPLCEFARPVRHRRERDDDKVWATLLLHLDEEGDEGDEGQEGSEGQEGVRRAVRAATRVEGH